MVEQMLSKNRYSLILLSMLSLSVASPAMAADEPAQPAKAGKNEDIRAQLAKKLPGAKPEDIRPTPIPGLYELTMGSTSAFITADGKYSIYDGDLYEMATKSNLSEIRRNEFRVKALAGLKESDTIVFASPVSTKHTVTVFVDVDCGYCRKLHSEIAELNKLGIRVRYTAYPRSGPGTPSWEKMETVWCSKNRRDALTKVQLDEDIGSAKCGTTPVASQYKLGEEMGVNGTPAIFTEAGDYIGGYLPPQKLLAHLDELKAQTVAAKKKGG
jgi:thiol:disulfide interchange protein DsbC